MSAGGGPFGFEECVVASSPAYAFVGSIIMGIVFALPCALITAELTTRYPVRYFFPFL